MSGLVNVLLSTYNGAKYLPQQLNSILNQSCREVSITARDDGSIDETPLVLNYYSRNYSNIKVYYGPNLGVVGSFFTLLGNAGPDYQYYAFSDQDDFWLPHKLEDALAGFQMEDSRQPLLYCSRVQYVDAGLNPLGYSKIPGRIGFGNALVENVVSGCTMVMNNAARALALTHIPQKAVMHDWWFYLVFSSLGKVIYDPKPNLKYRQHDHNVMGGSGGLRQFTRRARRFLHDGSRVFSAFEQAAEFMEYYGPVLGEGDLNSLKNFLASKRNLRSRIKYALTKEVWRQSAWDNLFLKCLILLGRY